MRHISNPTGRLTSTLPPTMMTGLSHCHRRDFRPCLGALVATSTELEGFHDRNRGVLMAGTAQDKKRNHVVDQAAATASPPIRSSWRHPFRSTILVLELILVAGGVSGTVQLMTGAGAPDVGVLAPLGLTTWRLPALWLFLTVVVPATWAAWLAWRRSPLTPTAVLIGAATLAIELGVQIPFLGWSVLQAVFGALAAGLAILALLARRRGWNT